MEEARIFKQKYPMYPEVRTEVDTKEDVTLLKAEAIVRVKFEDKYYLILSKSQYRIASKEHIIEGTMQMMVMFNQNVYRLQHLGLLNQFWMEDDDQSTEPERLVEADPVLRNMNKKHGK